MVGDENKLWRKGRPKSGVPGVYKTGGRLVLCGQRGHRVVRSARGGRSGRVSGDWAPSLDCGFDSRFRCPEPVGRFVTRPARVTPRRNVSLVYGYRRTGLEVGIADAGARGRIGGFAALAGRGRDPRPMFLAGGTTPANGGARVSRSCRPQCRPCRRENHVQTGQTVVKTRRKLSSDAGSGRQRFFRGLPTGRRTPRQTCRCASILSCSTRTMTTPSDSTR